MSFRRRVCETAHTTSDGWSLVIQRQNTYCGL